MKKEIWILIVAILALLVSSQICLRGGNKKEMAKIGVEIGNIAPDFSLYDTKGKLYSLKKARGKKSLLLVFWATWCSGCVEEIPELIKIHQNYSKKGLEVLSINIMEGKDKISNFISKKGINYAALLDSKGDVASLYKIVGIPANIVIDKDGVIRHSGGLPDNYDTLFKELTTNLKKKDGKKGK